MVFGSALLIFVILQPFLTGSGQPPIGGGGYYSAEYYSFKVVARGWYYHNYNYPSLYVELTFGDYWFKPTRWMMWNAPVDPYLLMATFLLEVSTLLIGLVCLVLKQKIRLLVLIPSVVTLILLSWFCFNINPQGVPLATYEQEWSIANGYWFTVASNLFFAFSAILSYTGAFKLARALNVELPHFL